MLLGIDVGGTFTDAVAVEQNRIVAAAKAPTTGGNLLEGILAAMDGVLALLPAARIDRVALSTTVVTNALVQGRTDRVGLFVMPGPGLNIAGMTPGEPVTLSGYVDHRGREVTAPDERELRAGMARFEGCAAFAVSGKFSVRNPVNEHRVAAWAGEQAGQAHVAVGSLMSGQLNFIRRTNSAYYSAAVWRRFQDFADAVEAAVRQRRIDAQVFILKADGGTLPLVAARANPVEGIFTGPAASVLGTMAMFAPAGEDTISLDIGGTTTDIALWRAGKPLFAERGAVIDRFPTAVRGFWLKSVGVGGDSWVRREDASIAVGPERLGPAMAIGGPAPTVTDAMIVTGAAVFGEREKALAAMASLADPGESPEQTARNVMKVAAGKIRAAIGAMTEEQSSRPVYRVEDIVHGNPFIPAMIVGVGGAAGGLVPVVAGALGVPFTVPPGAAVANAVGAAVARPTVDITFRADTAQGYYTVAELGARAQLPNKRTTLAEARILAERHLAERAAMAGIPAADMETVYEEEFNLVRGFSTAGKIITCRLQIRPGVLTAVDGRGVVL